MNVVHLTGHLGGDPELKFTRDGDPVVNVRIATNDRWKDKQTGERREATEWHNLTVWGKRAEIFKEYLKKGSHISVTGALKTRKWTSNGGEDHYTTEIQVSDFEFLDKKADA